MRKTGEDACMATVNCPSKTQQMHRQTCKQTLSAWGKSVVFVGVFGEVIQLKVLLTLKRSKLKPIYF